MSDDLNKTDKGDDTRINVNQEHEVKYWTDKFQVTEERLREAVKEVGPMVDDVRKYLTNVS